MLHSKKKHHLALKEVSELIAVFLVFRITQTLALLRYGLA